MVDREVLGVRTPKHTTQVPHTQNSRSLSGGNSVAIRAQLLVPGDGSAATRDRTSLSTAPLDERFDEIHRAYRRRVLALVRRRVASREQAEDVVQETFLRIHQALPDFDAARPLWPWVSRIATNACFDALRHQMLQAEDPSADPWSGAPETAAAPDAAECYEGLARRESIAIALGDLCPRQRRILVMKQIEGWDTRDVAEFEGLSVDAVKCVLRRAREVFRMSYTAIAEQRGLLGGFVPAVAAIGRKVRTAGLRAQARLSPSGMAAMPWSTEAVGSMFAATTAAALITLAVAGGGTSAGIGIETRPLTAPAVIEDPAGTAPADLMPDVAAPQPSPAVANGGRDDAPPHLAPARSVAVAPAPVAAPGGGAQATGTAEVAVGPQESNETIDGNVGARITPGPKADVPTRTSFSCPESPTRKAACDALDFVLAPRP